MPDFGQWAAPIQIEALPAALNLAVAFLLALPIGILYRFTHAGYAYSRGFHLALAGMAMIVCLTMMVALRHLALSVGLLGAVSVIRFRTAIKDPRDLTYLFLSVAVGLACAIGAYALAGLGTLLVCGVLLGLHLLPVGRGSGGQYLLTFCFPSAAGAERFKKLAPEFFSELALRSAVQIDEETFEYVYAVVPRTDPLEQIVGELKRQLKDISRMSLVSPGQLVEV